MGRNPYVGPRAFNIDESDYFFGREEETEILQGLVMSRRVVLLFAKSGVGKSSFLNAGVIPFLEDSFPKSPPNVQLAAVAVPGNYHLR